MSLPGSKLGIAVVGGGYWGTKLVREYLALSRRTNDFELCSVVDVSAERLEAIRNEIGDRNIRLLMDYDEILRDEGVNALHIATPNQTHYELTCKALGRGKHVLLEKPMALTSRDAFKLARMSEENGLVLQVGHIFRFNRALEKARRIIRGGELGRVIYANLSWASHPERPPEDRDIVFDLVPHPLDILNNLLDEWPSSVHAIGKSYLRNSDHREEVAFIHLEFPADVLGSIYVSWLHHGVKERSVVIVGEKATLQIDALNQRLALATDKEIRRIPLRPNNTIQDMQSHFIERLKGRGPSYNSAVIGAVAVQVLEAIHKSMNRSNG